ncbi:MAG: hypothetical protein U9Q62_03305 [Campylobacterota bacterium]|nr:hypothetical protein [Campylobacterota bacterium]
MIRDWFHHIFDHETPTSYQFGRSINASVNPKEPELFEASAKAFEDEKIIEGYSHFLRSLQNFNADTANHNITLTQDTDTLRFELLQGSANIRGIITEKSIEAECLMADAAKTHVAIKRRLLERNYQLTYCRFFTDEGTIKLKIRLDNTTMTPQKIFFPLREIALNADFEKEYIASEFSDEALLDTHHVIAIDEDEKKLKYRFLKEWTKACQESIKRLPSDDNAGMVAFTYLTLLLQVDYLTVPKKKIGQKIVRNITEYFSDDNRPVERKNAELQNYVTTLHELSYEEFAPQLYNLTVTFSPMERATHEEIIIFIDETLSKIRWYKNNRYSRVILTIYRYIAFYLLYNYGLHPSLRSLLHLVVEVHHADYFEALDLKPLYHASTGQFEKRQIISRIDKIIAPYQQQFKQLEPFGEALAFDSLEQFSHDFYLQLKHLDYTEV